jgi:hypothetical protein
MADLTVQDIDNDGVEAALAAASAGGDSFLNNERTFVHVKNADVTNTKVITITRAIVSIRVDRSGDVPIADLVVNVPPAKEYAFVAPVGTYGAKPTMAYSSSSGLTVAARRIPII